MKKSVVLNLKNDILQESPYCEHDWTWYKKIWVRKLIRRENSWLPFSKKSPWKLIDRPYVPRCKKWWTKIHLSLSSSCRYIFKWFSLRHLIICKLLKRMPSYILLDHNPQIYMEVTWWDYSTWTCFKWFTPGAF